MARSGMSNLITRWRSLVNDAGTAVWTDNEAQDILDLYRVDLWGVEMAARTIKDSGTVVYKTYEVGHGNLEDWGSGTAIWRVYDSQGTAQGTAGYTVDWWRGIVTFTADQVGSARYVDGRSYDLNGAAAHGWRELMGAKAELYHFMADGASYHREQWFDHCREMVVHYEARSTTGAGGFSTARLYRSDID